jgi:cytochrome c oxidase subunit 2
MRRAALVLIASLPGAGCSYQHYQSALGNAGADDRQFLILFAIFLAVCAIMYVAVIAFLIAGIVRRRRAGQANVVEEGRHNRSNPLMKTGLIAWGAVVSTGLFTLAIASFFTDRSMAIAATHPRLSITVTANQWWWDVQYNSSDPSKTLRTANELHLPVGVPARIILRSNDVIHSFWLPSLAGKQDLIPGRENDITIVPKKVGIYRGQCAEFCGVQHAHMAFVVDVDSYGDFIKWWEGQLRPAAAPTAPLTQAGYNFVGQRQCSMCHNIAGTLAGATVGPDLTHLASRRTVAAGALPMSEANLRAWITDPQSVKPGTKMPTIPMTAEQRKAVVAYLGTLK